MSDHPDNKTRLSNFENKASELESRLSELNQANIVNEELRVKYHSLHKTFRIYSHAYGRSLKAKLEKIQNEKTTFKKEYKLRNFLNTMIGPQSLCIRHALGAH